MSGGWCAAAEARPAIARTAVSRTAPCGATLAEAEAQPGALDSAIEAALSALHRGATAARRRRSGRARRGWRWTAAWRAICAAPWRSSAARRSRGAAPCS
eukprot:2370398-Pleurochrysis_carterae.AAC.1